MRYLLALIVSLCVVSISFGAPPTPKKADPKTRPQVGKMQFPPRWDMDKKNVDKKVVDKKNVAKKSTPKKPAKRSWKKWAKARCHFAKGLRHHRHHFAMKFKHHRHHGFHGKVQGPPPKTSHKNHVGK